MWRNVHPVYGAGIQTHDLWNMSLLLWPLYQGSSHSTASFTYSDLSRTHLKALQPLSNRRSNAEAHYVRAIGSVYNLICLSIYPKYLWCTDTTAVPITYFYLGLYIDVLHEAHYTYSASPKCFMTISKPFPSQLKEYKMETSMLLDRERFMCIVDPWQPQGWEWMEIENKKIFIRSSSCSPLKTEFDATIDFNKKVVYDD